MARATPLVAGARLVDGADAAQLITVGTPAWYAWLEGATTFAFIGVAGSFTARKERRERGAGYWKAYRKRARVVRSAYLGKTSDLILERLQGAAATLTEPTIPGGAAPLPDADLPTLSAEPTARSSTSLPTGTLTFLFTDIVGSTSLWEQQPQAMPAALARHDALVRQVVAAHGGVVFKTVGDSVYAVFGRAGDALAMRDHRDRTSFIRTFTGSNRYIVEYLAAEVFTSQPAHIQTFLLHTAILDRICGPLCDAVLGLEAGGLGLVDDNPPSSLQPPVSRPTARSCLRIWSVPTCLSCRWTTTASGIATIICLPRCCGSD